MIYSPPRFVVIVCFYFLTGVTSVEAAVFAQGSTAEVGTWVNAKSPTTKLKRKISKEEMSRLMSLSYLQGYLSAPKDKNVTLYNAKLADPGINLYISSHAPEAYLMDMRGHILHRWRYDISHIWPFKLKGAGGGTYWRQVYLFANGDLLISLGGEPIGIIKIDKDSHLIWAYRGECHHALFPSPEGAIYALTSKEISLTPKSKIVDNGITILTKDGAFVETISLFDLLRKSPFQDIVREIYAMAKRTKSLKLEGFEVEPDDVFHSNTIYVFDGRFAAKSPLFKKNNAMVSTRTLGLIIFIDLNKKEIVDIWRPGIWHRGQHSPILLDNGNFLIFDNFFTKDSSCVTEFDPITKKVVWRYTDEDGNFFTSAGGFVQRLSNGNTLITEYLTGRAFEVTIDGKIVWEFLNPHRAGKNNELIAVLMQMIRLEPNFPLDWLNVHSLTQPSGE